MYISQEVSDVAPNFRQPPFNFEGCFKEVPAGDDYFKMVVVNAFSIPLPSGEKFFIDSLKHSIKKINNDMLAKQVKIFVRQEALHRKSHIEYNKILSNERGYSLEKLESLYLLNSEYVRKNYDEKYCLALTVCLEHLTASAAEAYFNNLHWLNECNPEIINFWKWHAIEELDHSAVAFDVYNELYNDKPYLNKVMGEVYRKFAAFLEKTILTMVIMDGKSVTDMKKWILESSFMNGESGVVPYFETLLNKFYQDDFHPSTHISKQSLTHK